MQSQSHRIETFDPLLRDLVAWGLVLPPEREGGSWRLAEPARQRLRELAVNTKPVDAQAVLYFNHRCAGCEARGATRLIGDRYMCDRCSRALADPHPEPEAANGGSSRKSTKLHWSRDKGTLAS